MWCVRVPRGGGGSCTSLASIKVNLFVSSPARQPGQELRADNLLVSLEKWTEPWTWCQTDPIQIPALSSRVTLGKNLYPLYLGFLVYKRE